MDYITWDDPQIHLMLRQLQDNQVTRRILWPRRGETPAEMRLKTKYSLEVAAVMFAAENGGDVDDFEDYAEHYANAIRAKLDNMQGIYNTLKRLDELGSPPSWNDGVGPLIPGASMNEIKPYLKILCKLSGDTLWGVFPRAPPVSPLSMKSKVAVMYGSNALRDYSSSNRGDRDNERHDSDNSEDHDEEERDNEYLQHLNDEAAETKVVNKETDNKPMFADIASNTGTSTIAIAGSPKGTLLPTSRKRARSYSEEAAVETDADIHRVKRFREMRREQEILDLKVEESRKKSQERRKSRQRKHERCMIKSHIMLARINHGLVKE